MLSVEWKFKRTTKVLAIIYTGVCQWHKPVWMGEMGQISQKAAVLGSGSQPRGRAPGVMGQRAQAVTSCNVHSTVSHGAAGDGGWRDWKGGGRATPSSSHTAVRRRWSSSWPTRGLSNPTGGRGLAASLLLGWKCQPPPSHTQKNNNHKRQTNITVFLLHGGMEYPSGVS